MAEEQESPVQRVFRHGMLTLVLNRPQVLNTLNLEMIRLLRAALEEALTDDRCRLVLLSGAGEHGFCAGGDLKDLAQAVKAGEIERAERFFREEYELDLFIQEFPKPLVAVAHGITMGGGLGLAAGADLVLATESTRMAMPETRIGFFPDVGATGWLFGKCPPGYPEYLALTGYEMVGGEAVRLGLATHLVQTGRRGEVSAALEGAAMGLAQGQDRAVEQLRAVVTPYAEPDLPAQPERDAWVAEHFAGKASLKEIMVSLSRCSLENRQCQDVFQRLAERSPTALALTLKLLRLNEGRTLPEVLARELKAAHFIIRHPDYLEGIRARLLDKDDKPRWQPATLEEAEALQVDLGER
jgi:enoyl-CoA hydratase